MPIADKSLGNFIGDKSQSFSTGVVPTRQAGSWFREDWIDAKIGGTYTVVGTGTSAASAEGNADGVLTHSVTAAADASAYNPSQNAATIFLGSGPMSIGHRVRIPTLSDGTNNITARCGSADTQNADAANGVYFECDFANHGNSNNWFACTAKAGVRTKTDTGIVATTTFQDLDWTCDGTTATFTVNRVGATVISSNVPTAAMFIGNHAVKQLGAALLTFKLDYVEYTHNPYSTLR